jgi:regulator of protease activity HflC (stomatin/prohibitin superfamily)
MFAFFVIKQYERAVVFRLGKVEGPARGPGLIFVAPFVNRIHRVRSTTTCRSEREGLRQCDRVAPRRPD